MGLVHHATIAPTKQELVAAWLPAQPWAAGRSIADKLGEYRFDDPEGEVGVETIVWTLDDGSLVQTPLTYRAEPLAGGSLIDTCAHSVLGTRYVYDGCSDPVWASTLATAILTGGTQAQMYVEHDGERVDVPPRMQVRGSGAAPIGMTVAAVDETATDGSVTTARAGGVELLVPRVLGTAVAGDATLSWVDRDGLVLAALRRTPGEAGHR